MFEFEMKNGFSKTGRMRGRLRCVYYKNIDLNEQHLHTVTCRRVFGLADCSVGTSTA